MTYQLKLYTTGEELPQMECHNFFHSAELFHIIEKTPGQKPFMAVTTDENGKVVGHMLAILRRRNLWFPPFFYAQGRIYGEGDYVMTDNYEEVFGLMLKALTRKLRRRLCFFIEFSDLSKKMFGYRLFRQNGYFPISWQEVHNSLHSKAPIERLSNKTIRRIERVYNMGLTTREAVSEEEVARFHKLLNGFYRFKPHRLIPPKELFTKLYHSDNARIFVTVYNDKIIGGCVCAYFEGNAYLWYLASKRKSYSHLHPNLMTIWHAINWAWKHNYAHFSFLDVGLPYPRNPYREFILRFGGKPVANYRWFRFTIGWLNNIVSWFYNE